MKRSSSIHHRLLTLVIAVALPLAGLVGYGVHRQFEADRAQAERNLELLQDINEGIIRRFLDESRLQMERLAREPRVNGMNAAEVGAFFEDAVLANPELSNLRVLDPDGRIVASASPLAPEVKDALESSAPYAAAVRAGKFLVSAPYQGAVNRRWSCLISQPILGEDGTRRGTLVAPLRLHELAETLYRPEIIPQLAVGVVDRSGVVVLRRPEAERYIGLAAAGFDQIREALPRGQTRLQARGLAGDERTALLSNDPRSPWIVITSVPTKSILRSAKQNLWQTLAGTAIVMVLGAYLVARSARMIEQPVAALADAARDQAAGQTERLAPAGGPAEIAETARAFNEMITARRKAESELAASEHRYRTVIDQTGQMIYDLDLVTNTPRWFGASAIRQITGYSLEDFQTIDIPAWAEMVHADDRAEAVRLLQVSMDERKPYFCEYRFHRKDGSCCNIEDHGIFIYDDTGRAVRMIGRMSDITDRRRAEEERQRIGEKLLEAQKLESLGVLAGGIAHDFNNLLTGILGHVGLARIEAPATWSGVSHLEQIQKASHRAADLCKQMLAYSGKGRFVVQRINLNDLLQETAELLQISISKKALLRIEAAPDLPAINADATQMRQVVMNLVINASEALGEQTGQITVTTGHLRADRHYLSTTQFASELPPGHYVFIEISDTGSGMSRETMARIFDPFFTTKFTGRGLGLAAVLGIVRGHSGAIKVYSEPGRGTTFRILFPAVAGASQPLTSAPSAGTAWRGSGHVLVIDDEASVREVIGGCLQVLGFSVDTTPDGAAGIAAFRQDAARYRLVLLDLTMPHLDGEETFRQLRVIEPAVAVILMSGFNRADAVNRFVGKGLSGFVQKPFDLETLAREVRRVLEGRR